MNKSEAIKQAVEVLGPKTSNKEIQEYCSNTLGVEVSYAYTSTERKKVKENITSLNPRISLNTLKAFKDLIEKEGGIKELRKILPKAKLLYDLVKEVGGWDHLEEMFKLLG